MITMNRHNFDTKDFIENYVYKEHDLGANHTKEGTLFKVWAPTATEVILCLYKYGSDEEVTNEKESLLKKIPMQKDKQGIWKHEELGDMDGIYYTFLVTVEGVTRETADPYSKACGVNGQRSMVIDLSRTNPKGWDLDKMSKECNKHPVIY